MKGDEPGLWSEREVLTGAESLQLEVLNAVLVERGRDICTLDSDDVDGSSKEAATTLATSMGLLNMMTRGRSRHGVFMT